MSTRTLIAATAALLAVALATPAVAGPPMELQPPAWLQQDAAEEGEATHLRTLRALHTRRQMLQVHQVMAWTAAFSIIGAEVIGMINRTAITTGSIPRKDLEPLLVAHRAMAGTAMGTYWTAGVLAWAMPPPSGTGSDKPISKSRTSRDAHIILSIIHMIGMGLVEATGLIMANAAPAADWEALATVHTISGFVTAGFTISAAVVIARM